MGIENQSNSKPIESDPIDAPLMRTVLAAKMVTMRKSVKVIPLGIIMGLIVLGMNFVHDLWIAVPLLVLIGALSGFFVVPIIVDPIFKTIV